MPILPDRPARTPGTGRAAITGELTRRGILAGGAAAALIGLAACSSSPDTARGAPPGWCTLPRGPCGCPPPRSG